MSNRQNDQQNRQHNKNKNLSPCVGNCCLNNDDICLGCYRHIDEIVGWNGKERAEQIEIVERASERKSQASQN